MAENPSLSVVTLAPGDEFVVTAAGRGGTIRYMIEPTDALDPQVRDALARRDDRIHTLNIRVAELERDVQVNAEKIAAAIIEQIATRLGFDPPEAITRVDWPTPAS